jgi:hypothetical protein
MAWRIQWLAGNAVSREGRKPVVRLRPAPGSAKNAKNCSYSRPLRVGDGGRWFGSFAPFA